MTQKTESKQDLYRRVGASAFRGISGVGDDVQVSYSAVANASVQDNRVRLPAPENLMNKSAISTARGESDMLAIRMRYHNAKIHSKVTPTGGDGMAEKLFNALEDARLESIGTQNCVGMGQNIQQALDDTYAKQGYHNIAGKLQEALPDMVRLMAREILTGTPPPPSVRQMYGAWENGLRRQIAPLLKQVSGDIDDQETFAKNALQIIRKMRVKFDDPTVKGDNATGNAEPDDDGEPEKIDRDDTDDAGHDDAPVQDDETETEGGSSGADEGEDDAPENALETAMEEADGDDGAGPRDHMHQNLENTPKVPFYTAYTTQYDQTVGAEDLTDGEELKRLRGMLDQQMEPLQNAVGRLANRFQRRLLAQQIRGWEFDLEEGILDSARLAGIVTTPTNSLSFKMEKDAPFKDTVVTLLIDNSGSMRGRPIGIAGVSADILTRTLERCGVRVEVLGFTTKNWKGGESRDKWVADGRPANPGRLNDLRHIIYKSADTPYRRAKDNLGLMLREGILKENIDGEALSWAFNRLLARREDRRILMVISDGAPVDDATLSANETNYLERHLRDVITTIETQSPIELLAIGIGHDVTRYYKRAVTIFDVEQLGGTMMDSLADLFAERG